MAVAGTKYSRASGPLNSKKAVFFVCEDCGREVHGWPYPVGFFPNKREICARCWVAPRDHPNLLALPGWATAGPRHVRWDEELQGWVDVA